MSQFGEAFALLFPTATQRAGNFAQNKFVDALAHACAREILRRRHLHVMSAIVFDAKMTVTDERIDNLRRATIGGVVLMSQLVSD